MPDQVGVGAQAAQRLDGVVLAVGPRKEDDSDVRGHQAGEPAGRTVTTDSSITGLARRRSATTVA